MKRLLLLSALVSISILNGCDNRTQEARRWDSVAQAQDKDKAKQVWSDAKHPWGSQYYHNGLVW